MKTTTQPDALFPPNLPHYIGQGNGLSAADEKIWFGRLDVARRAAMRMPDSVWAGRCQHCRNFICKANEALVHFLALKVVANDRNNPLYAELVSEGFLALLRSVDSFEIERGYRFSTLAYRVISRDLAHKAGQERRIARHHTPTDPTDFRFRAESKSGQDQISDENSEEIRVAMDRAKLSDKERLVLAMRFLDRPTLGLKEAGQVIGKSKERVRQIQESALQKLRDVMGGR